MNVMKISYCYQKEFVYKDLEFQVKMGFNQSPWIAAEKKQTQN